MPRSLVFVCAILCFIAGTKDADADLEYRFESFSGFDPGWSFDGGFIEISGGFVGELTPGNVVLPPAPASVIANYSVAFTSPLNGGTQYTLTPTNSSLFYFDQPAGNAAVSTTSIEFPGPVDAFEGLAIIAGFQAITIFSGFVELIENPNIRTGISFATPAAIATAVPEPTLIAPMGLALLVAGGRRRRYRA